MKTPGGSDAAKRRAGEHAAERVTDGDVVGLGTGSTAAHAIRALGRAVDDGLALIKGGGAAHAREKVVDSAADRFVVVVDPSKTGPELDRPIPVELLPDARAAVRRSLRELGGTPTLRTAERKDGPVVTDNGNLVLDADFGTITDPGALATDLATIPGVVEHGLFVDLVDEVHVGREGGVTVRRADGE